MMLADAESFARAQNIFNPNSFDRKLQPIAKFIKDYMEEYKVMPDVDQVNAKHDIQLYLIEQHFFVKNVKNNKVDRNN